MKSIVILFISVLNLSCSIAFSQDVQNSKKDETGVFLGIGNTYDFGKNATSYTENNGKVLFEVGAYHKINFASNKYSFKGEYSFKFMNSDYTFLNGTEGVANQQNFGIIFKLGKSIIAENGNSLDVYLGPGIYTVNQKRIAYSTLSDAEVIKDGFGACWGMSVDFEVAGSIKVGKGCLGVATRLFVQPDFTIAKKNNVPAFYHSGISLALFYSIL